MSDLEKMLEEHISEKVNKEIKNINNKDKSIILDIKNQIEDSLRSSKASISDLKNSDLNINAIEAEGGLRSLIMLANDLNSWVLTKELQIDVDMVDIK